MKVSKLMTKAFDGCAADDKLSTAVRKMWEQDCGVVPVLEDNRPTGMITDRDVAIAVSSSGRLASDISIGEISKGRVSICREKDDVRRVLKIMAKKKLRRLPVTNKSGEMVGIISIADIVNASASKKQLRKPVLKALQQISRPHPIVLFGD